MGSCAMDLCSIAAARGDIFFEIGFGGPWDVAAGALVLTEAGGVVIDPAGESMSHIHSGCKHPLIRLTVSELGAAAHEVAVLLDSGYYACLCHLCTESWRHVILFWTAIRQ